MVALYNYALGILAVAALVALAGAATPVLVAAKSSARQIALNPQPLPPGEAPDTDFDFDFG
ncbi:MAG: hypothetical protein ABSG83_14075 [Roseiarcus sp.]|jgi:hypothetical protein